MPRTTSSLISSRKQPRSSCCDLHGDVLAVSSELVLAVDVVGGLEVDQDAAKVAKDLGGEIKIVKFTRFVKGEGLEKRADDFAAEVASMVK